MSRRLLMPLGQEPEIRGSAAMRSRGRPSAAKRDECQVTIDGWGFAQGAAVRFQDTAAAGPVTVKRPTRIVATVPSRLPDPKTADVTVTVGVATSPTGPADECTYAG
ncbi:IPT/TIG domain-containing protein [Streptomyces sp. Je 1-4]|uniref:IPT/TIG domain-containing protein n=1 Tax=Streptomyces TaxID=1883 RepID=UPI0021DA19EF|nr:MULTISPECIES: IPT/TIG domain-containing protein [unclassified Streptomyces]UYB38079.1 IPT/TIG domain-containing protein [Streptomyces sp. Je 1-4]UZQ34016.1 IPT/TIG domain-containing protein [Streptomyces sp. Je 1-4] [Streptomyces sp. Je 1-4 4N24]UZQ41434.1 IPT/TIG domain-containing protein [Streptomyces sp. Je 1-4] [Streptomyces sp. Je 1-4 4N24_ara]